MTLSIPFETHRLNGKESQDISIFIETDVEVNMNGAMIARGEVILEIHG